MATTARAARRRGVRPLVALLALLGVLTLVYPSAARWFSDRRHAVEITGYAEEVELLPDAQGRAILDRAAAWNADLPTGPLRGVSLAGGSATSTGSSGARYLDHLVVPGTDVIASLGIPAIDLDVPVRHGTGTETLSRGAGHLAGSSLPVGGEGTHAVLTGHSGLVQSSMFDALHDLESGDEVVLTVLGATLRYEVDAIEVVTPDSTGGLRIEPGRDLLTLVTCTPVGVNSHRLLVHAHRVADTAALDDGTVGGSGILAGFPWWAVVAGVAVLGAGVAALHPGRVLRPRGAHRATGARRPAPAAPAPARPTPSPGPAPRRRWTGSSSTGPRRAPRT